MVVIAFITDLSVCRKILEHLNLPSRPPEIKPARPAVVAGFSLRLSDDWLVDEWWDDEGKGREAVTPPGSTSRGPP
jgi:hypothetical protein